MKRSIETFESSALRGGLLVGQRDAPPGPVDLQMMFVMHHAFRRDVTAFIDAVANADIDDRSRWKSLLRRWQLFATVIHHHHASEDAGLWPALLDRVGADEPAARTVLDAMVAEHARIDPALDTCRRAFESLAVEADEQRRADLNVSLAETRELLEAHLGREERDAMALVQRLLTPEEWHAIERDHFRPAYSPRALLSVVPWAMSGLPPLVRQRVLADAGQPMGLLWRATRRSFARADAKAFGANPARLIDTNSPIAVVGATGTMGGHVLDALVARHTNVRVLVRHRRSDDTFPSGVTQVVADLHDEQTLRTALADVRAALYISPHDTDEEQLAANFVRAAEATGTRIVFAGVHVPAHGIAGRLQLALTKAILPTYRGKLRIGQRIAASRTDPVIFSPTNFFQNDEIVEAEIHSGTFPLPIRFANRVDVRDLAELCARALLEPGHPTGEHLVAGPASLSGQHCAQMWADALHHPVRYVGDDDSEWVPILERRVHGQKLVDFISTSRFLGRRKVVMPGAVTATTALLGRPPRNYSDYVAERARMTSPSTGRHRQDARGVDRRGSVLWPT